MMDSATIWHAAHAVAAEELPRIQSGMCLQPGLAATLAHFAIEQSNKANETIDVLVAALEDARNALRGHGFDVDDLDAALALARA